MAPNPEATSPALLPTTAVWPRTQYAQLRRPFPIQTRQEDDLPINEMNEISFLQAQDDQVPWTGYYANWSGAHIAVENYEGIWFEIERDGASWRVIRVARAELALVHAEIYMTSLEASGEPVSIGQQESNFSVANDDPAYDELVTQQPPLATQRTFISLLGGAELEIIGIPPEFDGDRAKSASFLTQFNRFIRLNRNTRIARDPFMRAAYLVNIMMKESHNTVKQWAKRNSVWLSKVYRNPDMLPRGMNAWDVLESDFKESFKDLGLQLAAIKLQALRMEDLRVEKYIAEFEYLTRRAGIGEPFKVPLFVKGLPPKFADECIADSNPKSFDQWTSAAVRNGNRLCQRVLQALLAERLREIRQSSNRGASVQGRNEQDIPPGRPRTTTPRNLNPSAAVYTNRKAINKNQYRRERRCFRCQEQGHIIRHCPY
jgi:hypothetical protein